MEKLVPFIIYWFLPCYLLSQFNVGLKGGLNYSTIESNSDLFKPQAAYHLGIINQLNLTEKWDIRMELLYSSEGAAFKEPFGGIAPGGIKIYKDALFHYLNLFALTRFEPIKLIHLELGVKSGLRLNEKDFLYDKRFEIGAFLGAGIRLNTKVILNIRYNYGFIQLFEPIFLGLSSKEKLEGKNRMLQISIEFYPFDSSQ